MGIPYQSLQSCGGVLLAARGSSIDSFDLGNGALLSTWTVPQEKKSASSNGAASVVSEKKDPEPSKDGVNEYSPPAKRRKLSEAEDESVAKPSNGANQQKKENTGGKKGNKRSEAVITGLDTPAVIALTSTKDGLHVIAVTGEDKSIRVFSNGINAENGKQCLEQLSQR
jgi:tRNA (guanine-N(7)-)-methyltransferase subunit TRM82